MKKKALIRVLAQCGWWIKRQGGNHEIWTNGELEEAVPRHREINEILARRIIRRARCNKAKED